jgi:hypothetical protein
MGQIILQGPSKDGLYPIEIPASINKARAYTMHLGVSADFAIWHFVLGHQASQFNC